MDEATTALQPTISAGPVTLRPWRSSDIDAVFAACQDNDIQHWTTVPRPYLRQHAEDFIENIAPTTWSSGAGALFAVERPVSQTLVGSISVLAFHEGVAALGYWAAPSTRGRGDMTHALRSLTRWCLRERRMARVELAIEDTNARSRLVAERVGFVEEGTLRQRMVLHDRRINIVFYSVVSQDKFDR